MKPETQKILDDYSAIFHPGVKDRPYIPHPKAMQRRMADGTLADVGHAETAPFTTDPLHAASAADVRRQWIEMRELVREAVELLAGHYTDGEFGSCIFCWSGEWGKKEKHKDDCEYADWLRRAREAAK